MTRASSRGQTYGDSATSGKWTPDFVARQGMTDPRCPEAISFGIVKPQFSKLARQENTISSRNSEPRMTDAEKRLRGRTSVLYRVRHAKKVVREG